VRILMLVATSVATDTRVLREAETLAGAGHRVHVIGKQVPPDWNPPAGVAVTSVGAGSVLRPQGSRSLASRRLSPPLRVARWALLPQHRNQSFSRWATGVLADGRGREFDVVHAHDFTALGVGRRLADLHGVPLVYDSHELWSGRPRIGRPTPLQAIRERRAEAAWGAGAVAVLTVGDGVAAALRDAYGWDHVQVVRNTFPRGDPGTARDRPTGAVYAGRLAPFRELEVIARASRDIDLPITLMGPADDTWLAGFDPGAAQVEPAATVDEVDVRLVRAGLALVTHSDRWANHRLAMPNKLFHAVKVGVPVVASDVGELGRLVRAHGIGTVYPCGDPAGLVGAVRDAVARYGDLCQAVRRSSDALSWDRDAAVLLALYERLGASARRYPEPSPPRKEPP
jgi:glycosyltransferase involved in cell wall biosynthesis